jgi:hypothetical protein
MLNLFNNKQNSFIPFITSNVIEKNTELQSNSEINVCDNTIYYPFSSKEWSTNIYSYNKSYIKSLISHDSVLNKLVKSYFNMLEDKIKILFKRRRSNKIRYSANKVYVSRAELNHTNTNLSVTLYLYNKQKSSFERFIKYLYTLLLVNKIRLGGKIKKIRIFKNRLFHCLKNYFTISKKWLIALFKPISSIIVPLLDKIKKTYFKTYNIPGYSFRHYNKIFKLQKAFITYNKNINFNKLKMSNIYTNWKNLGIVSLIIKLYNKNVNLDLVELRNIRLNSDVFSSAVALKLRDRKNKAVRILRKAILQMVRIPDLHTLRTFDDYIEFINKNNIIKTIKQQIVSGVRFEASGRLTRRLTAMRAVFKYRYAGSLKNIRSSFNSISSTMLRGYVKSNSQYTLTNSKTRNGTFGLKTWVSSHNFMVEQIYLSLHIIYLQLVKGKAIFGYPWAVPQLFSDYLRILKDKYAPGLEWALHNPPKPHAFTSLPLQSNIFLTIYKSVILKINLDLKRLIINYLIYANLAIVKKFNKNVTLNSLIVKIYYVYTLILKVTDVFVSIVISIGKLKYPLVYNIFMALYYGYIQIVTGNLHSKHICMFLFLGFYIDSEDYFYWVLMMGLCAEAERYILNHIAPKYPNLSRFIVYLIKIVYVVSLTVCVDSISTNIILPIYNKFIITLKKLFDSILKMSSNNSNTPNTDGPGNNNPTPNPNPNPNPKSEYTIGSSKSKSDKKNKDLEKDNTYGQNYDNFMGAIESITECKPYTNRTHNMPAILNKYREYLPTEDKVNLNDLLNKQSHKVRWNKETTVKEYWQKMFEVQKVNFKQKEDIINIFYRNSKMIQSEYLGGKTSYRTQEFKRELHIYHDRSLKDYSFKKSIILEQIKRKDGFEEQLRSVGSSAHKTFTDNLDKFGGED